MGNSASKTKKKEFVPLPHDVPPSLKKRQRKRYIKEYQKEHKLYVLHMEQLLRLHAGVLSKTEIAISAQLAVDLSISLYEMKRAWTIFERLASTLPDRVTIRELVLYFHVRRTVFVDLLFHSFANYENDKKEQKALQLKSDKQGGGEAKSSDDDDDESSSDSSASTTTSSSHSSWSSNHVRYIPPKRLNLSFPNLIKTFVVFGTCDHEELVDRVCIVVAGIRNGKTLLDVAECIHGSPLPEDPSILLNILNQLETVETDDVCSFSQTLKMPVVDKKKLLKMNLDFPTLLYPIFKMSSLLKEKFLGTDFWDRMRKKTTSLGLRGFFGPKELRRAILKDRKVRLLNRCKIELQEDAAMRELTGRNPVLALSAKINKMATNARPTKHCAVVDMNLSNSADIAWLISCHNMCKTIAVEKVMNDFYEQEYEALELGIGKAPSRLPGEDLMWIEMCDGIYQPFVYHFVSKMGFQVSSRVKSTIKRGNAPKVDKHGEVVLSTKDKDRLKEETDNELMTRLLKAEYSWDAFWRVHLDPRTKRKFYYNLNTGEATWKNPKALKRLRTAEEQKNKTFERSRKTEAHNWSNNVGTWKASTIRAKTDAKRRKRSVRRKRKRMKELTEEDEVVEGRLLGNLDHYGTTEEQKTERPKKKQGSRPIRDDGEHGAGGTDENIRLYRGNQVMVVQDADKYRIKQVPAVIEYADEDDGLTYDVVYGDGRREGSVARTRIIVGNIKETLGVLSESESSESERSVEDPFAILDETESDSSSSGSASDSGSSSYSSSYSSDSS